MEKLIISPKTKVFQLIETYPDLEKLLIEMVPAFVKLKNPILRKTVAKITTLQQAASIGGINPEILINKLRNAVGQDDLNDIGFSDYNTVQPEWYDVNKITKEFDIRSMLHEGEQPVNLVIADLVNLEHNQIYKIISPFVPAPLIDKASSLNIDHWVISVDPDIFEVYFFKK